MSVGNKISIAFVLVLVVLAAVGGVAYVNTQHLLDANRWVLHTHEVQEKLNAFLTSHLNAETRQRGYLITGEDRYLEPYDAALHDIQENLSALRSLTSDNVSQQQSLRKVRELSDAKLAELAETIRLRKRSGFQSALTIVLTDRGKKIMDDLRAVVDTMNAREQSLLHERTAEAEAGTAARSGRLSYGCLRRW